MTKLLCSAVLAGVALAGTITMTAQSPQPGPAPTPAATGSVTKAFAPITVVGCVQREADFRRAKGDSPATEAAAQALVDHWVLINTAAVGAPTPTPGAPLAAATVESVYQLTGPSEGQARELVGRRVEVVGKANPAPSTHANPEPIASATAAKPAAADAVSPRLLPELEVMSIKATEGGGCPTR